MTLNLKYRGEATGFAFADKSDDCPNKEWNIWQYATGKGGKEEWAEANLQILCKEGMISVILFVTYDLKTLYMPLTLNEEISQPPNKCPFSDFRFNLRMGGGRKLFYHF